MGFSGVSHHSEFAEHVRNLESRKYCSESYGNLHFKENEVFSYDRKIAHIHLAPVSVIVVEEYSKVSPTTTRHRRSITRTMWRLPNYFFFVVPHEKVSVHPSSLCLLDDEPTTQALRVWLSPKREFLQFGVNNE